MIDFNEVEKYSALALRDVVVFPHMVMPLFVGRTQSINAINFARENSGYIFLVTQKDPEVEDPKRGDLYSVGVIAKIVQYLEMPDGSVKVLVEGVQRAKIKKYSFARILQTNIAEVLLLDDDFSVPKDVNIMALETMLLREFENYANNNNKISPDIVNVVRGLVNSGQISDALAFHLPLKVEQKQYLLDELKIYLRYQYLLGAMLLEQDLLKIENRIQEEVKKQIEKNQRNYYLNEQIKAIQRELGQDSEHGFSPDEEVKQLKAKVKKAKMPKDVEEKVITEINKLMLMSASSSEATVVRGYVDWMLQMPWSKTTKVKKDLVKAQEVLDADHYGLERVKERILEYLAVQSRLNKIKGPILCLVGPPGVGKTSLGQSIANATGRKYVRMALGGVRDEAEIRGHRKTYIGSMPGKLMQKMAKVGVKNPLFLLDEIDKMSTDMRGDPASALLEVLDPEQNTAFNDHFLEVDYDLSDVMFVATSNSMNMPAPLVDRMEVIRLSGYTEDEKLNIATKYLIKKQMQRNGLTDKELTIDEGVILAIIRYYTREAGVRGLEKEIAKICRKAVKILLTNKRKKSIKITEKNLSDFLGVKPFEFGRADKENRVGEVTGLAWTEVGGDLLTIEVASMLGKGKFTFTGSLGDVMKESIQTAMTVTRTRAERLGISADFYEKRDIHIHVPDGATPKDGPSAGIAMCTALVSCLTGNPVKAEVAMTGEVSLHGKVLPIGGLKEKLLAAHRGGIKTVLIPKDNLKDLAEIPDNAKQALQIIPVENIEAVLELALQKSPWGVESSTKVMTKLSNKRKGSSLVN